MVKLRTWKRSPGIIALLAGLVLLPTASSLYASPANIDGWTSDIDFVISKIESVHPKPWYRITEEEFTKLTQELKADLSGLSDEQVVVRLMQLVASLDDGHTTLLPIGRSEFAIWYPPRVDCFADGYHITAVGTEYEDVLGARVFRVGNMTIEDAFARVASVASADSRHAWPKTVPPFFSNAAILRALGINDGEDLPLDMETMDGRRYKISIRPVRWLTAFSWTRRVPENPCGFS